MVQSAPKAPKRPINLALDADLIRQARAYTPNLSSLIEDLLQAFVAREHARRRTEDLAVDRVIEQWNSFHQEHGLLSDEFSSL